jgi:hypothetical protein
LEGKEADDFKSTESSFLLNYHYKHLQLCPERKCKIGMGKTYTGFYRKWSEVKNKLY